MAHRRVEGMVIITDLYRNQGGCWYCGERVEDSSTGRLRMFDGYPVGESKRGVQRPIPTAGNLHEDCARTILICLDSQRRLLSLPTTVPVPA